MDKEISSWKAKFIQSQDKLLETFNSNVQLQKMIVSSNKSYSIAVSQNIAFEKEVEYIKIINGKNTEKTVNHLANSSIPKELNRRFGHVFNNILLPNNSLLPDLNGNKLLRDSGIIELVSKNSYRSVPPMVCIEGVEYSISLTPVAQLGSHYYLRGFPSLKSGVHPAYLGRCPDKNIVDSNVYIDDEKLYSTYMDTKAKLKKVTKSGNVGYFTTNKYKVYNTYIVQHCLSTGNGIETIWAWQGRNASPVLLHENELQLTDAIGGDGNAHCFKIKVSDLNDNDRPEIEHFSEDWSTTYNTIWEINNGQLDLLSKVILEYLAH